MNIKLENLIEIKLDKSIDSYDQLIQIELYCFFIELVPGPEPYRTLIKFLTQRSQKLLDRNLWSI